MGPAARQNLRFGKPLDGEIYVASEASATPLRSYAPQSNFSAPRRVAPALDSGNTDAIQPSLPVAPVAGLCRDIRPCGESPPSISFQAEFHHDAGRSFRYGQRD